MERQAGAAKRAGTRTVKTSQLRVGDIVGEHGMRVRIEAVNEYPGTNSDLPVYSCPGTVLNVAEVREAGIVPMYFLRCDVHPGGACWHIQGNDLATWTVEA